MTRLWNPLWASFGALVLAASAAGAQAAADGPWVGWRFAKDQVEDRRITAAHGRVSVHLRGRVRFESTDGVSCLRHEASNALVVRRNISRPPLDLPKRALTVEAWVSVDTPLRWGGLVGVVQDDGEAERGWVLGFDEHHFSFALASRDADDGDGKLTYLRGGPAYERGRWYHVVGTYDGASMQLFVNGEAVAESAEQSGDVLYPFGGTFVVGAYRDGNENHPLEGRLHSVNVWARTLSPDAIRARFESIPALAIAAPVVDRELRFLVPPYLQSLAADGVTVMWETTRRATSRVEYDVLRPISGLATAKPGTMHEVRIRSLAPDRRYFYRVVSESEDGQRIESPLYAFQTAVRPGADFAFAVIGDTQANPDVVARIARHCHRARPRFVIMAGDLVADGRQKTGWTLHFFARMQPLMARICAFPVLGNHEHDAALYFDYMSLPAPESHYEFRFGDGHFLMMDSNRPMGPESEQHRWLRSRLAGSNARWKFVVHHHPPFTSDADDYGDASRGESTFGDQRVRQLVPLYDRYGVDVVFSGHVHAYERTWPIAYDKVARRAGVVYVTTGGGGGALDTFAQERPWFSKARASRHHVCHVEIREDALRLRAVDLDGTLLDSFERKKPPRRRP